MDQFSQPVLSKKLLTIIANSTTSTNQIIFKRAIASSDKYKLDDLSGFDDTSISTIKKASETVFSNVTIDGNGIQLTAIFSSNGNDSNYDINTILFTAEYGGQEFLAFSQIANYSLTVPAGSSKEVFNLTLKPKIIIDSVKNISTTVNPSGVATNEYVDSHDSELKKMIDEGTSDRKNIWTKFSDYILKSGNPQTIDTKLTFTEKINGTATKSDALATARTINGTNFDGTANISIKASNDSDLVHKSSAETVSGDKNYTGKLQKNGVDVATKNDNVASATKLVTPRNIGGVAFDGTADIALPGVNATGNQNTTGLANAVQSLEITNGTDLSTIKGYGGSAVYHIASGITLTSTPSEYSGKGAILKVTESGTTVYQELIDVVTDNGAWIRIIDGSTVNDWQTKGGGRWEMVANGEYYDSISKYFDRVSTSTKTDADGKGKWHYVAANTIVYIIPSAFDFTKYEYLIIFSGNTPTDTIISTVPTIDSFQLYNATFTIKFLNVEKIIETNWTIKTYEFYSANSQFIIKGVFRRHITGKLPVESDLFTTDYPFVSA